MFYGIFENWNDVLSFFGVNNPQEYENAVPVFASYDCEDYDGYATVIFIQHGKFWEVHGSHCSCFGLEDQWEPEETSFEVLRHMANKGRYSYLHNKEFSDAIDLIEQTGLETDVRQLQFLLTLHYRK